MIKSAEEAREIVALHSHQKKAIEQQIQWKPHDEAKFLFKEAESGLAALDWPEVRALVEALMKARLALEDGGHSNDHEGIAARCPNCDLCEIDEWDTEVRWDRQTPYLRLNQFDAPTNDQVAAFTVAELLEQAEDFELWRSGDRYCVRADGSTVMMFTAADALAQMRIHQIERGLVKP